jgi:hypothetical protein
MNFDDNAAVQIAMRAFYSESLAKVVLYSPETRDALKRNMNKICWSVIQEYLDNFNFCETPEEAFQRFVREYQAAKEAKREEGNT